MQGEHLNVACQVKSVYCSLGKRTSREKQFGTAFFCFSPCSLLLTLFSGASLMPQGFQLAACIPRILHRW